MKSENSPPLSSEEASTVALKPSKTLLSRAILNGVFGDYLAQNNNPLAIDMGFYHNLRRLQLNASLVSQLTDMSISNKVVVLIHGLTNLETVWNFDNAQKANTNHENYGTKLQAEFGYTPFFLRYNSGLPTTQNGEHLSEQLERLVEHYPMPIDDLVLVGFSMGGLLSRYAQKSGARTNKKWLNALSKCIYIGSPHEGSPIEKAGFIVGEIIRHIPLDHVNVWADWADLRSQGIKDLKLGLKDTSTKTEQTCESFTQHAEHYFISGSIGKENGVPETLLGDSLVRRSSALPASKPANSHYAHFEQIPHIPLAHSPIVYEKISEWLKKDSKEIAKESSKDSAKNRTKLRFLEVSPEEATTNNTPGQSREDPLSRKDLLIGAIAMALDTSSSVVNTTQTMHQSISKIPFEILGSIPVVKQISAPVSAIHDKISAQVYKGLKQTIRSGKRHLSP